MLTKKLGLASAAAQNVSSVAKYSCFRQKVNGRQRRQNLAPELEVPGEREERGGPGVHSKLQKAIRVSWHDFYPAPAQAYYAIYCFTYTNQYNKSVKQVM